MSKLEFVMSDKPYKKVSYRQPLPGFKFAVKDKVRVMRGCANFPEGSVLVISYCGKVDGVAESCYKFENCSRDHCGIVCAESKFELVEE